MVRRFVLAPLAGVMLLAGAPALAQEGDVPPADSITLTDSDATTEEMNPFAMLGAMFTAEPLTPEQEGRLPQATALMAKLIPEGTMSDMMGSMFDKLISPMSELAKASVASRAAKGIGLSEYDLELTEEQAREIADMFDPAFAEREAREMALVPEMMKTMMVAMEPPMRKAMAELYAINFNEAELADIDAFFSTPTGASYARKSFTMASDPRIVAATFEALPAIMGPIGEMEEKVKAATADLPAERSFAELSAAERARITALTGLSAEDIEDLLAAQEMWSDDEWTDDAEPVDVEAEDDHSHDH
jgi:hypothetical protein